jgi:hypothetical protein
MSAAFLISMSLSSDPEESLLQPPSRLASSHPISFGEM